MGPGQWLPAPQKGGRPSRLPRRGVTSCSSRRQAALGAVAPPSRATRTVGRTSAPRRTRRLPLHQRPDVGLLVYNAGASPLPLPPRPVGRGAMLARNCATARRRTDSHPAWSSAATVGWCSCRREPWSVVSHLAIWRVEGVRHDLRRGAALARAAGRRCSDELGRTDTPALRRLIGDRPVDGLADPTTSRADADNWQRPDAAPDPSPLGDTAASRRDRDRGSAAQRPRLGRVSPAGRAGGTRSPRTTAR
jgi:hypothetical protein